MSPFASLTVLVVEDHDFQRRYLLSLLRMLEVGQLLEAPGGMQALEILDQTPADVIFLDLKMPGMDGVEFIDHLCRSGFAGSVVLASGLEPELVNTVERIATAKGVFVLGKLEKPLGAERTAELLTRHFIPTPLNAPPSEALHAPGADELRTALDENQFLPWFQPKVRFSDGHLVGVEALARWQQADGLLCGPGLFVPVMEREGLIDALTDTISRQALQACRNWLDAGQEISVSLNLSPKSLCDPDCIRRLLDLALENQVPPHLVTLEVTESALAGDPTEAIANLVRLRMKEFKLSIDDFGTGYSSLQKLSEFPFTELKIDRSFVDGVSADRRLQAIVDYSVQLAGKLQLSITAEGVEQEADWNYLASRGCDLCQGYYTGKPVPAENIPNWESA